MKRQQTGIYEITSIGDGQVRGVYSKSAAARRRSGYEVFTTFVGQRDICTWATAQHCDNTA